MRHAALIAALKNVLNDVNVSPSRVIVGGSGIIGALGLRDINDLDVHMPNPSDFMKVMKHPRVQHSEFRPNRGHAVIPTSVGEIEFFTGPWMVQGKDFGSPTTPTMNIHGIPHWTPKVALEWKIAMRRSKDLRDIDLLKAYEQTKGMSRDAILGTVLTKGAFVYGFFDEMQKRGIEEIPYREHQEEPGGAFRVIFTGAKKLKKHSDPKLIERLKFLAHNIPTDRLRKAAGTRK